jgi:hypothetical protein
MAAAIAAAAAGLLIIGACAFFYFRARTSAREARAAIREALNAGKSVLYCNAAELTLNGEDVSALPQVAARKERGIILDPGSVESVGTFAIRDDEGKLIATFSDAELGFTLKAGREYELGVYLFDTEILGAAVAHRQLGPSGSGQGFLALACVAC